MKALMGHHHLLSDETRFRCDRPRVRTDDNRLGFWGGDPNSK